MEPNAHESIRKKVYKYNIEGVFLEEYKSLTKASQANNVTKNNLWNSIINKKLYKGIYYTYTYNEKFDFLNKNKKLPIHKIKYNDEILILSNKEIMEKFNVSRYYLSEVKRNRIKKPKFNVIY